MIMALKLPDQLSVNHYHDLLICLLQDSTTNLQRYLDKKSSAYNARAGFQTGASKRALLANYKSTQRSSDNHKSA